VNHGQGQFIDVALYESVFNVMESLLPEYGRLRRRARALCSALPGIAPTNAYRCLDDQYVLIAGNGDSIFRRLMSVIGRPDLADDPELAHNDGRVARAAELDQAIEAWTSERSHDAVLAAIDAAGVPVGRIYSVADIATDPQYLAREMIVDAPASYGGSIKVPGIVPKLSATPGRIRSAARNSANTRTPSLQRAGPRNRRRLGWRLPNETEQRPTAPHQRGRAARWTADGVPFHRDRGQDCLDRQLSRLGYAKIEATSFTSPRRSLRCATPWRSCWASAGCPASSTRR